MYMYHTEDQSELVISFMKTTKRVRLCDEQELKEFKEKASKRRKHMQREGRECGSRERVPLKIKVWINGGQTLDKLVRPSGFGRDGVTFVYERFGLKQGDHQIKVAMVDHRKDKSGFDYPFEKTLNFESRRIVVVDFDSAIDEFQIR